MQLLDAAFWNRVRPLLDQALTLAPQDRASFLDQACADDLTLRAAVEQLLDELEDFDQRALLENPAADRYEALLADVFDPTAVAVPLEVGPYRTVRALGYGGMGAVFLAERVDGQFERQVALKLLRREMHSKTTALRFLHERQILARLQHPKIAQLHDGGVTNDGRPYFVMEYVEGQPITHYCDGHQLSIKERLGLFLQVCEALQYAHRNLVVHRDVKPSNILVTEEGQVKLLDFGIAKVLSGDEVTAMTQPGMPVLTPDYAAPEQVKGEAITIVTDVYALGILLYELLSGHRPYRVQGASMEEWVRVICETEPGPPSLVIAQQGGVTEEAGALSPELLSAARATTPVRLQRQVAGDLDTIVLKALRKEPERRYGSVDAMTSDIERFLEDQPIFARRDTLRYRLGKFVARHRVGVGVAVLLLVVGSVFAWRSVVQQRQVAVSALRADEVSSFLVDLFTMSDPFSEEEVRGDTTQVRVFLERGASQIEELSGQEEVQSMLKGVLGRVYQGLGEYEAAEGFFREALAQRQVLYGERSVEVAESMHDLGGLLRLWSGEAEDEAEGDVYAEAEGLLREALALRRQLQGEEHVKVAEALSSLAAILHDQGKDAEAETIFREVLAMRKKLLGENHPDVATTLNNLALVLNAQGNHAEAEAILREVLAIRKKLYGEEHPRVAIALNNLAITLRNQEKNAEAETIYREALAIRKKSLGEEHPDVATTLNNLANTLRGQGNNAEAEMMFREALALRKKSLGEEHPLVAMAHSNLANILYDQGNNAEAEMMYREALALLKKSLGEEHPRIAMTLNNLANTLYDQGNYAEAETMYRASLTLDRKLVGDEHPRIAGTKTNLAASLQQQGNYAEAEPMLREALALLQKRFDGEHPYVAYILHDLAVVLREQGKYAEAEPMLREVLALRKKSLGDEHFEVARTLADLGVLLVNQERYAEAETILQESFEIFEQAQGRDHRNTQEAVDVFVRLYMAWDKPEQAARYRAMRTDG